MVTENASFDRYLWLQKIFDLTVIYGYRRCLILPLSMVKEDVSI